MSNERDPDGEPYRSECRDRRNGMWSAFGLTLAEPHEFNTVMKAALSQLRLLDGAPTRNNTPRLVNLDQFWLKGSAPPLDQSDIQKLKAFDVDQFNLDGCPSKDEIETLFNAGIDWQIGLRRIIHFIVGGGTLVMASNIFDPFTSVAISALSFVFVYFYPFSHIERLLQWLTPHYEKYHRLCDARNKILKNVRDYIIEFEKSHNGFIWRLHQHLGTTENFNNERFNVLSATSKQQNPYYLADNYHQYIHYIDSAKKHFQIR